MADECLMSSIGRSQGSFQTFNTGFPKSANLECRVCEEGFSTNGDKVPRLLFCGHTFCHACLLRLPILSASSTEDYDDEPRASSSSGSDGGVLRCPFDRQPTPVDSTGVWGLKKNFALLEILDRNSSCGEARSTSRTLLSLDLLTNHQQSGTGISVPCDEDESHIAVLYCTVCASHLCQACSERSHATRTLHTHRRIPLEDKPREKPRCPAHPSHTVEFVCLEPTCLCSSPLMCFICKDYKHSKHKHSLLESEAELVRQELSAVAYNIKRSALQFTNTLRKLEQCALMLDERDDHTASCQLSLSTSNDGHGTSLVVNLSSFRQSLYQNSNTADVTPQSTNAVPSAISASPSVGATSAGMAHNNMAQPSLNTAQNSLMLGSGGSQTSPSLVSSTATPAASSGLSHVATARSLVRDHFAALRETLQEQENIALSTLETHVRERLCSIRQQQEDLSSFISQMVGLVLEADRCLQQDDGRVLVMGRNLIKKLQLLYTQQQQFDAIEQGLDSLVDSIPITFTKDNRIHIGAVLDMRVVTLGLDGAGKTSILFQLQQSSCLSTIPTIGFNVETLHYKNFKFTIWDVGGQPKLRPLWRHYYYNTQAVIFVVDSSDGNRVEEATTELTKLMMERELRDAPLLIFANKQDVEGAMSASDVSLALGAGKLASGRPWHVVGCDATTGAGLTEGLDWLTRQLGPPTS